MSNELAEQKIAFLTSNSGVEQVELTQPWQAVIDAGGQPVLLAPETGTVQAMNDDVDQADTFRVDLAVDAARGADYVGLVIPGGTTNADHLRTDSAAVRFVADFVAAGRPVAAICHGLWALVEADVLRGKTLTSYPSLRTDITNAGGSWVDEEVFVCPAQGWTLITSRNPGDLDAFCAALVEQFAD